MRVVFMLAGVLYFLNPSDAAEPDYNNVMVVVHTIDNCPPCRMLKDAYPRMHKRVPSVWWAWGHNGNQPATVSQHEGRQFVFMGAPVKVLGYPTIVIHSRQANGMFGERFRVTGFRASDEELLGVLIRRAAE